MRRNMELGEELGQTTESDGHASQLLHFRKCYCHLPDDSDDLDKVAER